MSGSHGDLFAEIGKLVLAINLGKAIDLDATAKDLAERYQNLGITEETFAKVVTRSIGAVRLSVEGAAPRPRLLDQIASAVEETSPAFVAGDAEAAVPAGGGRRFGGWKTKAGATQETGTTPAKSPFPSGLRLALLS